MEGDRDERTLRASDADRERIADLLRTAAGDGRLTLDELDERLDSLYAAKTYGELEPVIADLPGELRGLVVVPATARVSGRRALGRVGGTAGSRVVKAIFGGVSRRGPWIVPEHYQVKAVFGGVDLDLREAHLEAHEVTIETKVVFGGVNVVVPDDVIAVVDGSGVCGGFRGPVEYRQPAAGSPVVRVTGKAVCGGVNVEQKPGGHGHGAPR